MSKHCYEYTSRRNGYYYDESTDDFVVWDDAFAHEASSNWRPGPDVQVHDRTDIEPIQQNLGAKLSQDLQAQVEHSEYVNTGPELSFASEVPSERTKQDDDKLSHASRDYYAHRYWANDLQILDVWDPRSRVRSCFGLQPAQHFTDPELLSMGVTARRLLIGTSSTTTEENFSDYAIQDASFYRVGKVFSVLWADCARDIDSQAGYSVDGQMAHKARRFVVIKESSGYCSALPILTYGLLGVGKPRVRKETHAVIYTGRMAPELLPSEYPQRGETGMRPSPIRVVPDEPTEKLDVLSRLDFGKVHTIALNVKAKSFGWVHPDSQHMLFAQFSNVWAQPGA